MVRVGPVRPAFVGWTLAAVLAGALGTWAVLRVLSPQADVLDAPGYTLVTAERGTVGQTLRLNTSAVWTAEAEFANQAAGTVTSVDLPDGSIPYINLPILVIKFGCEGI